MGKFFDRPSNNSFNRTLNISIVFAFIYLIVGICLIVFPIESMKLVGYITGVLFIFNSINSGIKYFTRQGAQLYRFNILFMIAELILGIIIFCVPYEVSSFITDLLGIFITIFGINKVTYGAYFRMGNEPSWLLTITVGIMLILFGIIMFFYPFSNIAIAMLVGIFMCVISILDLATTFLVKKRINDILTIFW